MKEEEPIVAAVAVPGVERIDAGTRSLENRRILRKCLGGGVGEVAEQGEVHVRVEIAGRLHLEVGQQVLHAGHTVEDRRDDHHRPGGGGNLGEFEPGKPARRDQVADHPLQQLDGQLAGRHGRQQRDDSQPGAVPPVPPGDADRHRHEQGGARGDRAKVPRRGQGEEQAPHALPEIGPPRDTALELAPPAADQVIADVRRTRVGSAHMHLPGPLDAFEGQQQLPFAGRHRQFLDRVAVAVAAAEVHLAVDTRRVALQHLLDQAHALEELAPVERRDHAQTANQVGQARLLSGLMLSFRADRVLDRLTARLQRGVELLVQAGGHRAEGARALEQPGDEGVVHLRRPRVNPPNSGFDRLGQPVRGQPVAAARREGIAARAQVVEQRELERARPRPDLADRQRRDRLEGADETLQPLRVHSSRARSNELERQRVDAWKPGELVGSDAGQPPEEGRGQVVMDVARRGRDDVEVVEQPFGGRRHRLLTGVPGERGIDVAQRGHVLAELADVKAAAAAGARRQGQEHGQAPGVLLQQLDTEQFAATGDVTGREHAAHPLRLPPPQVRR